MDRTGLTLLRLALFAAFSLFPLDTYAQTTTWFGSLGDWGVPSNWSDGEPTAGVDAVVPTAGSPIVTQAGETCRNLSTGTLAAASQFRIESGDLTVVERMHIGVGVTGSVLQSGGTMSANELFLGNPDAGGTYNLNGGTVTVDVAQIATDDTGSFGVFTMSVTNPVMNVSGMLRVGEGGSFVFGAGTLNVGTTSTDGTFVNGSFTLSNHPSGTMTGFTLSDTATLSVAVFSSGVSYINVTGTVTLNGQLLVTDVLAPDGTYEILRGNSIQGAFTSAFLPAGWSWQVQGNSLFLTKGQVPVEPTSWGKIKSRYAPSTNQE